MSSELPLKLVSLLRQRAKQFNASAKIDMVLICSVLLITLLAFVGAERATAYLSTSKVEREARAKVDEAQAELIIAATSLVDPVSGALASVPEELEATLVRVLVYYLNRIAVPLGGEPIDTPVVDLPPEMTESDLPDLEPPEIRSEIDENAPTQVTETNFDVMQELYLAHGAHLEVLEELITERKRYLSEMGYFSPEVEVARINAEAEVEASKESALSLLSASQDNGDSSEYLTLASTILTKVGAVILAVWLTKVFVSKRRDALLLATFYTGVADAIEFKLATDEDIAINELIKALTPSNIDPMKSTDLNSADLSKLAFR